MLSFPLHFRRKYFTGEAYFTRRKAYITDLRSKSISLWAAHSPMRNPLRGRFLFAGGGETRSDKKPEDRRISAVPDCTFPFHRGILKASNSVKGERDNG